MSVHNAPRRDAHSFSPPKGSRLPWFGDRFFYGWIIVSVGFVTQFFHGLTSQGFGTYLPFLENQFGWSKAVLAMPRSIAQVNNSIIGPLEGFLVDRFGPRRVVSFGVFVMGGGMILFGLTHQLWLYFVSNIIVALGTGFQGLLVMSVAVNHWFKRKRSIAQSLMLLGYSMAGVFGIPLLVLAQSMVGWEVSAIGSGLLIWTVGLPAALLLRTQPEAHGMLPDGDPSSNATVSGDTRSIAEYDFSLKEALCTRAFWLLALSWAIGNMGLGAVQVHLFLHLYQDLGMTGPTAAFVWMVASLANVPARIFGGFLGDRVTKSVVLAVSMLLISLSIYILAMATTLTMAFLYAVVYGVGWGIRTPVMNAMQADYFGRKSLGVITGWLQSLSIPFTITAPVVVGYVADVQGTYQTAFIVLSIMMVAGSLLIFLTAAPKPPGHIRR